MTTAAHKALHAEMKCFFEELGMAPSKINSGAKIRSKFTPQEIEKALAEFYNGTGAKYVKAAEDFFKQIK